MLLTMEMCADALMLYTLWLFKVRVQFFGSLTPSPLSNPPPPLCRLRSIQPCLPVPHIIFFLWHSSPLSTAWYSGVGMHAPSQIHQLRSECRATARGNGGMRREREVEGEREKGREGSEWEGRSVACRHPSGTKLQTDREREIEGERGKKKSTSLFLRDHFC